MIKYKGQQKSRSLSRDQYLNILSDLKARKQLKVHAIVLLMTNKCMRISDVLNLKLNQLYYANGDLRPELVYKNQKQSKKMIIPLHDKKNESYFKTSLETFFYLVADQKPDDYLFQGLKTPKLNRSSIRQILSKYLHAWGIEQLSFHSFRKTGCKMMYDTGNVPIETIQHLLQHSDPSITRVYLDISRKDVSKAVFSIDM